MNSSITNKIECQTGTITCNVTNTSTTFAVNFPKPFKQCLFGVAYPTGLHTGLNYSIVEYDNTKLGLRCFISSPIAIPFNWVAFGIF